MRDNKLSIISSPRGVTAPSHIFYANDLIIFCKAEIRDLKALKWLFDRYKAISGQLVSNDKCNAFFGKHIMPRRKQKLLDFLDFWEGSASFSYLGVPIFKGMPKRCCFKVIFDKVIAKFSAWKGKCLSMAGRNELVKIVVQNSLVYSMLV